MRLRAAFARSLRAALGGEAVTLAPATGGEAMLASRVWMVRRRFAAALEAVDRWPEHAGCLRSSVALRWRLHHWAELPPHLDALGRAAGDEPSVIRMRYRLARVRREWSLAAAWCARLDDSWAAEAASVSARVPDREMTVRHAARAIRHGTELEAVLTPLRRVGAYDAIEALDAEHGDGAATAEHRLFEGRWAKARDVSSDSARARYVRAAAGWRLGEGADTLHACDDAVDGVLVWRALACHEAGEIDEALALLNRARHRQQSSAYFAADLVWAQVMGKGEEVDGLERERLGALVPEPLASAKRAQLALQRLVGNLTPYPSIVEQGRLTRIVLQDPSRQAAIQAQHRIVTEGDDGARRALAELPPSGARACYLGELHLWCERWGEARAAFEEVLAAAPRTRWAYVGLAASYLGTDEPDRALAILADGRRRTGGGVTYPVYRAEAYWRLGRLEDARSDLERAVRERPGRVASLVLLARVAHQLGDDALARHAHGQIEQWFTGLWSDARELVPNAEPAALAAQMWALLRGSRSSGCALYFAPGTGLPRALPYPRPVTSAEWEAEERASLEALLQRQVR